MVVSWGRGAVGMARSRKEKRDAPLVERPLERAPFPEHLDRGVILVLREQRMNRYVSLMVMTSFLLSLHFNIQCARI